MRRRTLPGTPFDAATLVDQALETWRTNAEVTRRLLRAVPLRGLAAAPLNSRGRNVARVFAHLHQVRHGWLLLHGRARVASVPRFKPHAQPSRRELLAALRASDRAMERFLRDLLERRVKLRFFRDNPLRYLAYFVAHDSHHRGQIALALKQLGMKLPQRVALNDLWYVWYFGRR
jgi:uncharacterized damage-inducible protein DinB